MIRLILKNLWKRSSRNGWLILELIVVAVILRQTLEPFMVKKYINSLPMGIQTERLYYLTYNSLHKSHPQYRPIEKEQQGQNVRQAINVLENHKDIESASAFVHFTYIGNSGTMSTSRIIDTITGPFNLAIISYLPNTNFFKTLGIRVLENETVSSLDQKVLKNNEVITTDLLKWYYKNDKPLTGQKLYYGKQVLIDDENNDYIVGCCQHVRQTPNAYNQPLSFDPQKNEEVSDNCTLVFRLKKDVSPTKFEAEFPDWAKENLHIGNYRTSYLRTFTQDIDDFFQQSSYKQQYHRMLILVVFLLINIFLGVTGSFWIQTQKRHEEIGIMLSYGGKPRSIIRMLLTEGAILCTVSVIIGCFICLQYILISASVHTGKDLPGPQHWIDIPSARFTIVSIVTYLIMLFCTLLGIYIPSKKISKMQICDALHNE